MDSDDFLKSNNSKVCCSVCLFKLLYICVYICVRVYVFVRCNWVKKKRERKGWGKRKKAITKKKKKN